MVLPPSNILSHKINKTASFARYNSLIILNKKLRLGATYFFPLERFFHFSFFFFPKRKAFPRRDLSAELLAAIAGLKPTFCLFCSLFSYLELGMGGGNMYQFLSIQNLCLSEINVIISTSVAFAVLPQNTDTSLFAQSSSLQN